MMRKKPIRGRRNMALRLLARDDVTIQKRAASGKTAVSALGALTPDPETSMR
jgi:hypothetical protein